jgi:hypothetical protein
MFEAMRIVSIRISDKKANHISQSFARKKHKANLAGIIDKMNVNQSPIPDFYDAVRVICHCMANSDQQLAFSD